MSSYILKALPCRTDNYIWIIHNDHHAWVIDPSLAAPVQDYIAQHGLILADILITHHHHDHVDGITGLLPLIQGEIFGCSQRIPQLTKNLEAPSQFTLSFSNININILATHGHTYDHVSYFLNEIFNTPILFCGDTIFSAGCGRVFDGDFTQYFDTFLRLMQLPDDTQIACAHEYTLANLEFALAIDSTHALTQQHYNQVKYACARDEPSVPTALALEKDINPFMRCIAFETDYIAALTEFALRRGKQDVHIRSPLEAFMLCRQLKNAF